jgi:hypothetical protein
MKSVEWKTYRTRFLVKAKQLSSSLSFIDPLGRQHCGRKGDYLVESSDGVISIAPRQIFEDIYVTISSTVEPEIAEGEVDQPKTDERRLDDRKTDRPGIEAIAIEELKHNKFGVARQQVHDTRIVRRDDDARVRRKLPMPCRDRRPSGTRLGLM